MLPLTQRTCLGQKYCQKSLNINVVTNGHIAFRWKGNALDPGRQFSLTMVTCEYGRWCQVAITRCPQLVAKTHCEFHCGYVVQNSSMCYLKDLIWRLEEGPQGQRSMCGKVRKLNMEVESFRHTQFHTLSVYSENAFCKSLKGNRHCCTNSPHLKSMSLLQITFISSK